MGTLVTKRSTKTMLAAVTALLLLSVDRTLSFTAQGIRPYQRIALPLHSTPTNQNDKEIDLQAMGQQALLEVKEISSCASLATSPLFRSATDTVTVEEIVLLCDQLDALVPDKDLLVSRKLHLRQRAMEFQRYELLAKLLGQDCDAYVAVAAFLSPNRIPRDQLPNVQDVPVGVGVAVAATTAAAVRSPAEPILVADCALDDMVYKDSPLDTLLLGIFRKLVTKNTGGVTSEKPGILGLLEQGRTFMLQPGQTPEAQHKMVYDTLGGLMTPVLPPFYRIFMSGVVPKLGSEWDGKQFGPWFYAPFLTTFITPTFFKFLVGPSRPNRRKDGQPGGLLVEKCKFLQESGCKGMCLHQCKLPAQQFFAEELGLSLTVSPNFETQECQWSFGGDEPPMPADDPSFPKGCLVGCESRKAMAAGTYADLCN